MSTRGSRAEFERLFLPHLQRAYSLARWMLRNAEDAEDMVQDAYLKAYQAFDSYAGGDAAAYMLAIVRNTALSHLRRASARRNVVPLRTVREDDAEASDIDSVADDAPMADEVLIGRAERDRVRAAIEALPLPFREVIVLRELEELSYAEIASLLQVPVGTVMSRLARARGRLKELLGKELSEGGESHGLS